MFRNYFKTAIRNLLRYKGFSLINILSLSIGITGCLVISLFVFDEKKFDKSIEDSENIYRIYEQRDSKSAITYYAPVPPMYGTFLQQHYPEVETSARILMSANKFLMEAGEKSEYEDKGWFVDSSFFKIFPFTFLRGDPATALNAPFTVVLSEDVANRMFGSEDPVGKTVFIDKDTFEVKGVMAKLPSHFHLDFNYLMSLPSARIDPARMERWSWHQFFTYVKLKPGTDAGQLQEKFQAHVKKEIHPTMTQGITYLPFFQPLKDIHLKSADFIYDNAIRGNESYVKGLTIIALFVLIIACFNFINLATARSFRRAKEIGVRKVAGAERRDLIIQFLGETVLLSTVSMIIATIATLFLLPLLNQFTGKSISFNPVANPLLALIVLGAGIFIGMLAGIYPSLILSGFRPIAVLKNMKSGTGGHIGWLRQGLVVIQFSLSALLIVSSIIVYRQIKYLNNKDLGFEKEQVVFFPVRGDVERNIESFKSELKRSSNIASVTSGYGLPGDRFAGDGINIPGRDKEYSTTLFIGDYDYLKTLGLRLVAGRDFSRDMATDSTEAFIINETAVKEFGFGTPEKALGQPMTWNEWSPRDTLKPVKQGKVIGVVQDFHYKSLHEKVSSSVIQIYPQVISTVAVKVKTADLKTTVSYINDTWKKFSPGYPLDYQFLDESYGAMYKSEQKLGSLIWIFTLMAIFIGCMGLFGLAAFSAEQRVKEIGIRKVLGASVFSITGLLSKNFVMLVLISSLIAFPIAWWAMNKWLQDFSYRISITWWVFLVAGAVAILIAIITVSFQTIRAAIANPVKSLRTE